jgi:putative nucleotidyltransferase with HDIG domain
MTDTSLAFGREIEAPGISGTPPAAEESLVRRIELEIQGGKIELPVLPEAAGQIRDVVARGGGARDIVAVIEREPTLAAAVLRYANSVAYAGLKEITDLQQAVTRLGFLAVEQTVLALSARNAFTGSDRADEQVYRRLWTHAIATALAARKLAPRSASVRPETVFLAGLLHDIGKVVVLRCAATLRRRDPARYSFEEGTLLEFFEALHCRVGDELCASWNIPGEIREVVRRHHDENLSGPNDLLVAIVQLASRMAAKLGASLKPDPEISLLDAPAAAMLRLDDVKLASLLIDVEDDLQKMQEVL